MTTCDEKHHLPTVDTMRHNFVITIQKIKPLKTAIITIWCGQRDSNSHALRRWNLNPVRLPISPRPH